MTRAFELFCRCRRVHALLAEIRDTLCAVRPDLFLTVNIWNETSRSNYIGVEGYPASRQAPGAQYGLCTPNETFYRYAGIDLTLFAREKNIHLCGMNGIFPTKPAGNPIPDIPAEP